MNTTRYHRTHHFTNAYILTSDTIAHLLELGETPARFACQPYLGLRSRYLASGLRFYQCFTNKPTPLFRIYYII